MKSQAEVREETAETLALAVTEVTRRAIQPELQPFKDELKLSVQALDDHAGNLKHEIRAHRKSLDALGTRLDEVVELGRRHAVDAGEVRGKGLELIERIDAAAGAVAAAGEEQLTTVSTLRQLADRLANCTMSIQAQSTAQATILDRAKALSAALDAQARELTEFAERLASKADAQASKLEREIAEARKQVALEGADLKNALVGSQVRQEALSRALIDAVAGKIESAVTAMTASIAAVREASAGDLASLADSHDRQQQSMQGETKKLAEALRGEVNAGWEDSDRKFKALHDQQRVDLAKSQGERKRIFQLLIFNVVVSCMMLAAGGVALWLLAR